jgi:hypothetical protein
MVQHLLGGTGRNIPSNYLHVNGSDIVSQNFVCLSCWSCWWQGIQIYQDEMVFSGMMCIPVLMKIG